MLGCTLTLQLHTCDLFPVPALLFSDLQCFWFFPWRARAFPKLQATPWNWFCFIHILLLQVRMNQCLCKFRLSSGKHVTRRWQMKLTVCELKSCVLLAVCFLTDNISSTNNCIQSYVDVFVDPKLCIQSYMDVFDFILWWSKMREQLEHSKCIHLSSASY